MILDLFAGPGGWSEGLRMIDRSDIGMEWDGDACLTRSAAGHRTVRCDVATYPTDAFGDVEGLIASPPCQAFSMAGTGAGRREIEHLHAAVEACRDGWTAPGHEWEDERTPLILEPLRYASELRPDWIACEQVPPALPVWEHMADVLRAWGYDARAVKLHSEQWGVPQTRTRAFLLAHRDVVRLPKPTHQRYRHNEDRGVGCEPDLFGHQLQPWVSMADALGWVEGSRAWDRRVGGFAADLGPRGDETPAPTLTGSGGLSKGKDVWRVIGNNHVRPGVLNERNADEPALTVGSRADLWSLRRNSGPGAARTPRPATEAPCYTIRADGSGMAPGGVEWVRARPSTTLVGSFRPDMVTPPGHRDWSEDGKPRQDSTDAVRITIEEASVLQGFPDDYPWQGSKTSCFRQVGNAVPPPWAAAIIGALVDAEAP